MGNLKELLHRAVSGVQTAFTWEDPEYTVRSLGRVEGHTLISGGKTHTTLTQ